MTFWEVLNFQKLRERAREHMVRPWGVAACFKRVNYHFEEGVFSHTSDITEAQAQTKAEPDSSLSEFPEQPAKNKDVKQLTGGNQSANVDRCDDVVLAEGIVGTSPTKSQCRGETVCMQSTSPNLSECRSNSHPHTPAAVETNMTDDELTAFTNSIFAVDGDTDMLDTSIEMLTAELNQAKSVLEVFELVDLRQPQTAPSKLCVPCEADPVVRTIMDEDENENAIIAVMHPVSKRRRLLAADGSSLEPSLQCSTALLTCTDQVQASMQAEELVVCGQYSVVEPPTLAIVNDSNEIIVKCGSTGEHLIHKKVDLKELSVFNTQTFAVAPMPPDVLVMLSTEMSIHSDSKWVKLSSGSRCPVCSPDVDLKSIEDEWIEFLGNGNLRTGIYHKQTSKDLKEALKEMDLGEDSIGEMGKVFQTKKKWSEYRTSAVLPEPEVNKLKSPLEAFVSGLPGEHPGVVAAELLITRDGPGEPQAWHSDFTPKVEKKLNTSLHVVFCLPDEPVNLAGPRGDPVNLVPVGPRRISVRIRDGREYNLVIQPGVSLAMQGGVVHRGLPVEQDNAVFVSYVVTDKFKMGEGSKTRKPLTRFQDINEALLANFRHGILKQ